MSEVPTKEMSQVVLGDDGQPLTKNAIKKLEKAAEKERRKQEVAQKLVI
jgi:aspartyl-tRNA synthetase